jgi:hypothetical protein
MAAGAGCIPASIDLLPFASPFRGPGGGDDTLTISSLWGRLSSDGSPETFFWLRGCRHRLGGVPELDWLSMDDDVFCPPGRGEGLPDALGLTCS